MTSEALDGATLLPLFATPLLVYRARGASELARDLEQVVLERMARSPGVSVSNRGGWHSANDLETWPEAPVGRLMTEVRRATREIVRQTVAECREAHFENWRIEAWANVNVPGAFNVSHDHVGADNIWSGVFYVEGGGISAEARNKGGRTKLEDRSMVPKEVIVDQDPFGREHVVVPEDGLMVLFPASLRHYVEPYCGDETRITIAFNLKHDGFVIPLYEDMQRQNWWWRNFRGLMLVKERLLGK